MKERMSVNKGAVVESNVIENGFSKDPEGTLPME
jgi:hypothetical protein